MTEEELRKEIERLESALYAQEDVKALYSEIAKLKRELALSERHRDEWKYKYIALLSGRQTT